MELRESHFQGSTKLQFIITATDNCCSRLSILSLPYRASFYRPLEAGVLFDTQVDMVLYRLKRAAAMACGTEDTYVSYKGCVNGTNDHPFARSGTGVVHLPPSESRLHHRTLDGLWIRDQLIRPARARQDVVQESGNSVILFVECSDCHVFVSKHLRNRHKCSRAGYNTYSVTVQLRKRLSNAAHQRHLRQNRADTMEAMARAREHRVPRLPRHVPQMNCIQQPVVLARTPNEAWVHVPINIDQNSLMTRGGKAGSCVVYLDLNQNKSNICFHRHCLRGNLAWRSDGCRHTRLAMQECTKERPNMGNPLDLTGFMALTDYKSFPSKRQCSACSQNASTSNAGGVDDEDGHHQLDGIELDAPSDQEADDIDVPPEQASNKDKDHEDYRLPSVQDIAGARWKSTLVLWCRHLHLPFSGTRAELQLRLLHHVQSERVGSTGFPGNSNIETVPVSKVGEHRSGARPRGSHKEMLDALKDRRCMDGSLCLLYDMERRVADSFQSSGNGDSTSEHPVQFVLPMSKGCVDEILYALSIGQSRCSAVVVSIDDGTFLVLRSKTLSGNWAMPGGYHRVHLRLRTPTHADTSRPVMLGTNCTCSEFRSQSASAGGKSRHGGSRLCLDILIVLAALSMEEWRREARPTSALDAAAKFLRTMQSTHVDLYHEKGRESLQIKQHMVNELLHGDPLPTKWSDDDLQRFHTDVTAVESTQLQNKKSPCEHSDTQEANDSLIHHVSRSLDQLAIGPVYLHDVKNQLELLKASLQEYIQVHSTHPIASQICKLINGTLSLPHITNIYECSSCEPQQHSGKRTPLYQHGGIRRCKALIGKAILLDLSCALYRCSNAHCSNPWVTPTGTKWTATTGLWPVRSNWYVHVINLEQMTTHLRKTEGCTPYQV